MNEYDSNRIYDLAKKIDYYKTENSKEADCYVLNTCHIREKARDKVYHEIGRLKKEYKYKKKPIVIVTGCVAQAEGEILIKREKYIDAIIGPQSFHLFNQQILDLEKKSRKIQLTEFDVVDKFDTLNQIKNSCNKISSYLTIQEGCDKFCKFCVVPYTRGSEYSRSIDELLKESEDLIKNGSKEIILLGQNVNAYKFKGKKISYLINEISKIDKLNRIRYTTSHPNDFSNDLIEIHGTNKKLMPLIHLPVQSGSNKILKSMNRKHSVEEYIHLVKKIKKINPLIKFSSDFIIGYPGETNFDFEATLDLMKEIKYINSYSFIYSPRPGTPAAELAQVRKSISKERLTKFQKISEKIKKNYKRSLLNKEVIVLFENRVGEDNNYFGRDEFSNSVVAKSHEDLRGQVKKVKIISGNQTTLIGEINQEISLKNHAA